MRLTALALLAVVAIAMVLLQERAAEAEFPATASRIELLVNRPVKRTAHRVRRLRPESLLGNSMLVPVRRLPDILALAAA